MGHFIPPRPYYALYTFHTICTVYYAPFFRIVLYVCVHAAMA